MSFFAELKRRNVMRVGIAYAVIGWVVAQVAEFAFETFGAPDWVLKVLVTVLLLGLPIALIIAWAFELTPDGIRRERDIAGEEASTVQAGGRLERLIIVPLVIAVAYLAWANWSGGAGERGDGPYSLQTADARGSSAETGASADRAGSDISAISTSAAPAGEPDKAPMPRSIAVLPFVNMSSDQAQEWFSDGLTEEILNALARTPDLLVAARTSSFKFKGSSETIPVIAEALGVAHVLEGSVRSGSDRLRVTAQLIRANDGFHLWSQTYDSQPDDVIQIQEDIALAIAKALETAMDPDALAAMVSSGTRSVPAYNAYLEGLAVNSTSITTADRYSLLGVRDAFNRAVELDPEFASAYWELANFWEVQAQTTNIVAGTVEVPRSEMIASFESALEKAIRFERDPVTRTKFRVLEAAEKLQLAEALRLNTEYLAQRPNDQDAQQQQLNLLSALGKVDALRAAIQTFEQRDGYDVLVTLSSVQLATLTNDPQFAKDTAFNALQRFPDNPFMKYQAHRTLLWADAIDNAAALIPAIDASDLPQNTRLLARMRQACAEGQRDEAQRLHERLMRDYDDDLSMAWISSKIMGYDDKADEMMLALDERRDLTPLVDFLSYYYFDAGRLPNLVAFLKLQGMEPREPIEMTYRCPAGGAEAADRLSAQDRP